MPPTIPRRAAFLPTTAFPLPRHTPTPPHTHAPRACARTPSDPDPDDVETDPRLSRRVFTAGVTAVGGLVAWEGLGLFGGDAAKRRLAAPFRSLFTTPPPPPPPRAAVDAGFAARYYELHAAVAAELGIVGAAALRAEEAARRERARPLFPAALSPRERYNYELYARVHCIAVRTGPAQRRAFEGRLGEEVLRALRVPGLGGGVWQDGLTGVLERLVEVGWVEGWSVAPFDEEMLAEDGRGELTVTCDDVYTLPTALLIGEEQFEEVSPKVSGVLRALLALYGFRGVSSEDYYLDTVYRANAADFAPTQLVTQFNFLAPAA